MDARAWVHPYPLQKVGLWPMILVGFNCHLPRFRALLGEHNQESGSFDLNGRLVAALYRLPGLPTAFLGYTGKSTGKPSYNH